MTQMPDPNALLSVSRHRALFLSDLHMGAFGCKPERILDFLRRNEAETIYLVGDILDTWHPLRVHWSPVHDAILGLLFLRAQNGTRIIYLPGNHDHVLRNHYGTHLGCVEVMEDVVHETGRGEKLLVFHGDVCDRRPFRWHMMTRLGSRADGLLRRMDHWLRGLRRSMAPEARTPIEVLLDWVNAAMRFGNGYEVRLLDLARRQGLDGVVCGHFHKAALHRDHGLLYANCGDWMDSFTALAEDASGRLAVLAWEPARAPGRDSDPGFVAGDEPEMAGL